MRAACRVYQTYNDRTGHWRVPWATLITQLAAAVQSRHNNMWHAVDALERDGLVVSERVVTGSSNCVLIRRFRRSRSFEHTSRTLIATERSEYNATRVIMPELRKSREDV